MPQDDMAALAVIFLKTQALQSPNNLSTSQLGKLSH
jgi:hypothetical protein